VQSCRKINIKKNNIHKLSLPQTRERDKKKMVKIKLKRSCFRRNLNFFHSKKLLLDKNKFYEVLPPAKKKLHFSLKINNVNIIPLNKTKYSD